MSSSILVTGASGQVGTALKAVFPTARFVTSAQLDLSDSDAIRDWDWSTFSTVINAAAYTAVDEAETVLGRRNAWAVNAVAPGLIARELAKTGATLVHLSSDYVFDGSQESPYAESAAVCPLGVYAQSKAAGDIAVSVHAGHYIVRTSWVIGEGTNFVRTMAGLAERGIRPSVVDDQVGRLSFTQDIASGIAHLLNVKPEFGIYNLTNSGPAASWFEIAQRVFELTGHHATDVSGVSTEAYNEGKTGISPRPLNSVLNLSKLEATGYVPPSWEKRLEDYLANARPSSASLIEQSGASWR